MSVSRRTFIQWTSGALGSAAMLRLTAGCGGSQTPDRVPVPADPAPAPPQEEDGASKQPESKQSGPTLLILGGTGFLGPQLVEFAQKQGYTVTLFNRGKTNPQLFPNVEKLRGNRDGDLKALEGRRWDAVIDTSGYVPRVVRASAELLAPNVKQYIFISTISVYADFAKEGITEDYKVGTMEDETSEDVRTYYGQLKALCEKAVYAAMPDRTTVIRPGLIVGPGDPTDRFTYWPLRVERGGEVLAPGDGKDKVQFIDVRDLAEWTVAMAAQGQMGTYNAVGPSQAPAMSEFLQTCKDVTGSNATFTWASAKFLAEQKVEPWMHMTMWVPPEPDSLGFSSVDGKKAEAKGLRFRPTDEIVRDTLQWFHTLPAERQGKLRAGLSAEREVEVLAAWKKAQEDEAKAKTGKGKAKPKAKGK